MTIVARRIIATPARSASSAWAVIINLLAPEMDTPARRELENIAGIASSLISDEAFRDAPAVVYGSGPRVRLYCLYDDDAIVGDNASDNALAFTPTEGDWKMSLPCPADDLAWVQAALKKLSNRITARDLNTALDEELSDGQEDSKALVVNREAFFNS